MASKRKTSDRERTHGSKKVVLHDLPDTKKKRAGLTVEQAEKIKGGIIEENSVCPR